MVKTDAQFRQLGGSAAHLLLLIGTHLCVNGMCHPGPAFKGRIRREYSSASGWDRASALVIHDNDALRGDLTFRHLERRRDRAIGKQPFSSAKRYRMYLQPELIDQIMLDECLNEIRASVNVQIRTLLLLELGDFFRNISV